MNSIDCKSHFLNPIFCKSRLVSGRGTNSFESKEVAVEFLNEIHLISVFHQNFVTKCQVFYKESRNPFSNAFRRAISTRRSMALPIRVISLNRKIFE